MLNVESQERAAASEHAAVVAAFFENNCFDRLKETRGVAVESLREQ